MRQTSQSKSMKLPSTALVMGLMSLACSSPTAASDTSMATHGQYCDLDDCLRPSPTNSLARELEERYVKDGCPFTSKGPTPYKAVNQYLSGEAAPTVTVTTTSHQTTTSTELRVATLAYRDLSVETNPGNETPEDTLSDLPCMEANHNMRQLHPNCMRKTHIKRHVQAIMSEPPLPPSDIGTTLVTSKVSVSTTPLPISTTADATSTMVRNSENLNSSASASLWFFLGCVLGANLTAAYLLISEVRQWLWFAVPVEQHDEYMMVG